LAKLDTLVAIFGEFRIHFLCLISVEYFRCTMCIGEGLNYSFLRQHYCMLVLEMRPSLVIEDLFHRAILSILWSPI